MDVCIVYDPCLYHSLILVRVCMYYVLRRCSSGSSSTMDAVLILAMQLCRRSYRVQSTYTVRYLAMNR